MNRLILDRVAIWCPKPNDNFAVRKSPAGRTYFENNIARTSESELYRYAKNYTIGKGASAVKVCLIMMSKSTAEKQIEKFLDETAKKIDIAFAQRVVMQATMSNFEYTDFNYKEKE